jgi:hypothetical protein
MPAVTIISDETRTVDAAVVDGRMLVATDRLPEAIGWDLKPEGLCRGEVCVPVRDRSSLAVGDAVDVAAVGAALRRPTVVDAGAGIAAMALDAETRRQALDSLQAPDFVLDDLDGTPHHLSEWRGRKKLLTAFASW